MHILAHLIFPLKSFPPALCHLSCFCLDPFQFILAWRQPDSSVWGGLSRICHQEGPPTPCHLPGGLGKPTGSPGGPWCFLLLSSVLQTAHSGVLIKVLQIALAVSLGLFFCCYWIPQSQFWPFFLCILLMSFSALLPFCSLSPTEYLSCSVWFIGFTSLHFSSLYLLQCF